jgi:hypothetical protein
MILSLILAAGLPEGNYDIIITLAEKKGQSVTTVKAVSRRLMVEKVVRWSQNRPANLNNF